MRRTVVTIAAAALLVGACGGDGGEIADFGPGQPGADAPELPVDVEGLTVADVPEPDGDVPPADADLTPAGWSQVAAWIRRENADGRPVLVNVYASWCIPCVRELPLLIETANAEPDVRFLGVNADTQEVLAAEMNEEYAIPYPTVFDPGQDIAPELGARTMPHTAVFDTEGRMVGRVFGELTETTLGNLLDEVREPA